MELEGSCYLPCAEIAAEVAEAKDFLWANLEVVEAVMAYALATEAAARTEGHGCSLAIRAVSGGQQERLALAADLSIA